MADLSNHVRELVDEIEHEIGEDGLDGDGLAGPSQEIEGSAWRARDGATSAARPTTSGPSIGFPPGARG